MDVFSTEDLTGRTFPGGWAGLFAAHIEAMEFRPAKPESFSARLSGADLGPLSIAHLTWGGASAERAEAQLSQKAGASYFLMLQVRGEIEVSHYGNIIILTQGDFVLCDSAAPLKIKASDDVETLFLKVAAGTLKEHLPSPECFCGRALKAGEGLTATAAAMALNLFGRLEAGLSLHYQDRVARHLLDIVATAYALAFDTPASRSSIVSGRCAMVKLFIEQHLRDPELTPCSIATRMKLSSRYMRMIFASENETVSAYILRRRLVKVPGAGHGNFAARPSQSAAKTNAILAWFDTRSCHKVAETPALTRASTKGRHKKSVGSAVTMKTDRACRAMRSSAQRAKAPGPNVSAPTFTTLMSLSPPIIAPDSSCS